MTAPRTSRFLRLAATGVSTAAILGGLATPAHAAPTPKITNVKVTPGGTKVKVAFNVNVPGFTGVEVGRAPLTPAHKTYAQQYGDFVNGANGVFKAKTQNVMIPGLSQHTTYWATIQYQAGGVKKYRRNLAFTTLTRHVNVHVNSVYIDGDGDEHGCGEVQATGAFNPSGPLPYPYGASWLQSNWTAEKDICTEGYVSNYGDLGADVPTANTVMLVTGAVDDDTVFGCTNSFACGDDVIAEAVINVGPKGGGVESYSTPFTLQGYEYGGVGPAIGELGIITNGTLTVSYH
jgi:hypothetical protein